MNKLLVTAIMFGLFAVTPAALAQGQHNQGGNSDQSAKSDQRGSKSDRGVKSDQGQKSDLRSNSTRGGNPDKGVKSDNAKGYNQTRTQSQFHNTPSVRTHKTVRSNRRSRTIDTRRSADLPTLRRNVQAPLHFHAGDYRPPQGYEPRHWSYGERLPRFYFVRDYWILDYFMYALFSPPDGYIWVRVGDDALLIDEETGEIVRVVYGVFY